MADKHLDDLYDTSKLKVPPDYGVAGCLNCGAVLPITLICPSCHAGYDQADVMYHRSKPLD